MKNLRQGFLPRLSTYRPITVVMIFVATLVVGAVAYLRIGYQLIPSGYQNTFLGVWVGYSSSNPAEVEKQIAIPLEEAIRTVRNVESIESNSSGGGCWTWIEFYQKTNMYEAYNQLRDRMDRLLPSLPDEVDRIWIRKWGENDEPVTYFSISLDRPVEDPYFLAERHIKNVIERVQGVANVEVWGIAQKSVQIEVDEERVKAYNIDLYQTIQKLMQDNFALTSGYVEEGRQKLFARSLGRYPDLEAIQNLPIKGTHIRLKDVAEVTYGVPEIDWVQRVDLKEAIRFGVFKESSANTVAVGEAVRDVIENELPKDPFLAGVTTHILFDQGDFIIESVRNLRNAAFWGGMFAFCVIFFFLRDIRMTLVITLAIPVSLLITMTVMYFSDFTLNVLTMMGLMLSVGLVVDNSIVVLENIFRRRQDGWDRKKSAAFGASEVSLAITMATLTTVVVFLPLILISDDAAFSFYMWRIGMPVCVALVASLFVALVFIPLSTTTLSRRGRNGKEPKSIQKLRRVYERGLRWVMRRRVDASVIALLVLFVNFGVLAPAVGGDSGEGEGNVGDLWVVFELPQNYTLERSDEVITAFEESIYARREEFNLKTIDTRFSRTWGTVRLFLNPSENRQWYQVLYTNIRKMLGLEGAGPLEHEEVSEELKKMIPEIAGVEARVGWGRQDSSDAAVAVVLYGDDTATLAVLAAEAERRLRTIPEILSIHTDLDEGADEVRVRLDRDRQLGLGIEPSTVAGTIRYALAGIDLPDYRSGEKEIDVKIQLRKQARENLEQLKNITIPTAQGTDVPLGAMADFQVERGYGTITRRNGRTRLAVRGVVPTEKVGDVMGQVDEVMESFEMPAGYEWDRGASGMRRERSDDARKFAMYLAITLVFLLMGVLFESFVLPLSVIISIPFALFGANLALVITGTDFSIMAGIGVIILIGIVVNNAIVLIDLVNRLRAEGVERTEAILEAGRHRMRPILMTALTTICGLIPMAAGNASMVGIPYAPMGIAMMGGLASSTFLTLFLVPLLYSLMDDLRIFVRGLISGQIRGLRREAKPSVSEES